LPEKIEREANPFWDAFCQSFKLKPTTKAEKTRVGKLARDLKAKTEDADMLAVQVARYSEQHPDWTLTPEAVMKHWDSLVAEASTSSLLPSREPTGDELREYEAFLAGTTQPSQKAAACLGEPQSPSGTPGCRPEVEIVDLGAILPVDEAENGGGE
jgi:hypothetical protein